MEIKKRVLERVMGWKCEDEAVVDEEAGEDGR